jgi:23S rRNA (pseudouridine1915-N3)-methyltransferase
MRFVIVAVGRGGKGPGQALLAAFARRRAPPIDLKEVEERRPMTPAERKPREAEKLLAAVPPGAKIVALDERGKSLTSAEFAATLGAWRDQGAPAVAFLIGGADGHDDSVRQKADLVLNLGTLTWPHMLVRGLIAEQIYRAQCILDGHPYHRG